MIDALSGILLRLTGAVFVGAAAVTPVFGVVAERRSLEEIAPAEEGLEEG